MATESWGFFFRSLIYEVETIERVVLFGMRQLLIWKHNFFIVCNFAPNVKAHVTGR